MKRKRNMIKHFINKCVSVAFLREWQHLDNTIILHVGEWLGNIYCLWMYFLGKLDFIFFNENFINIQIMWNI